MAELREAPSRNTVARILDPQRRQGVNHVTLVQFFYALGLHITAADWEPISPQAGAFPESIGYRTLVFTDMGGSSALWNRHGDAFEPVRQRHVALLGAAAQKCQGEVVDVMGDGAFAAAHRMKAKCPEATLHTIRIGYEAVYGFGGAPKRVKQ